jgi:pimeloyl-ACP methyl ester carboxylesterase
MKLQMASPTEHHLVLLPGLDGTGQRFAAFLSVLPPVFAASVARFPADQVLSPRDQFSCVRSVIPWGQPYVLVAESTAGPLALKFVEEQPEDIRAVVLVASFVTNPIRTSLWHDGPFARPWLEKEPTPQLVREHLLGADAPDALVESTTHVLQSLPPEVRSARTKLVVQTDAGALLRGCRKPILYLQAQADRFVSAEAAAEVRRLNPNVKVVRLPGPHLILQHSPRQALEAIREFLNNLPAA